MASLYFWNEEKMKSRKLKANEQGGGDKLAAKFDADLLADYETNGPEAIREARLKSPEKYLETVNRRIAAVEPKADDYENCNSHKDIARKMLQSVGFQDPDDAS